MRFLTIGLGLAAAWTRAACTADAICESTDAPAPDVTTLVDLTIRFSDCSTQSVGGAPGQIYTVASGVQRIASVPSLAQEIEVSAQLSRGGDFTRAQYLLKIVLRGIASSASDLVFPESLKTLQIVSSSMASVDGLKLPSALTALTISESPVASFKNLKLPASIRSLDWKQNKLTVLDFALPPNLQQLDLSENQIDKLEQLVVPDSLKTLTCRSCSITSVRGVKWSRALEKLDLSNTLSIITAFEIRASDLPVIRNSNFAGRLAQPQCADNTAEKVSLPQGNICVISDERFNEKYFGGAPASGRVTPTPGGRTSAAAPGTSSSTDDAAGETTSSSAAGATGTTTRNTSGSPSSSSRHGNSTSDTPEGGGRLSVEGDVSDLGNGSKATSNTTNDGNAGSTSTSTKGSSTSNKRNGGGVAMVNAESASSSNTAVIVLAALGTVVALFLAGFVYRYFVAGKRLEASDETTTTGTYSSAESPSSSRPRAGHFDEKRRVYDIRNDPDLSPYRLDFAAIAFESTIARGGFGVVFTATLAGQRVAVKQMLPDTWRSSARVASFMDEIRMCVSLDHPKVVQCLGVAWTSLRDLSVVIEYMDGGDLHSMLQHQAGFEPSGREWSQPWTTSSIKSKTSIAADVADALVYLHSFESPIVHRDLKAKNVLLDTEGNAKLSDFGISREVPLDETMTREIGTVAWIAPEVLRGDRYTEQADIYSLGVLLVELDRCCHPYAHEVDSAAKHTSNGSVLKNTQIAILVSSGKLRPTTSTTCPERVRHLVARCLAFDSAERPNAMEIHHELRLYQQSTAPFG